MCPETTIHKGLEGVVVDRTAVSRVSPDTDSLTYRGYAVEDLAEHCAAGDLGFEDVAYLLWNGELPSKAERDEFCARERALRQPDKSVLDLVTGLPRDCDPMDVLRTAVSYLGTAESSGNDRDAALQIAAAVPTVIAVDQRRRRGLDPVAPDDRLGFAENFLHMCFGEPPSPELVRDFEISLLLYAEYGFNASTFAARVVTSTESDIYSAVTAAIGALKGPLHGGANEAVMRDMLDIGDPDRAEEWVRAKLARKEKVMGFGHRVYRNGDSRVPTMRGAFEDIARRTDAAKWLRIADVLQNAMDEATGIKPNIDFVTGPAYYLLGFDIEFFTPIFVMGRVAGWTAHVMEQRASNALIRPRAEYAGEPQRAVPD